MATDLLAKGLAQRSPAQLEAVNHNEGPLLVLAGPGSGKTATLVHRIARLIRDGADPATFLVATFTNRAAEEFRERLWKLLGPSAEGLWMGTLHSAGCRILRKYGRELGIYPGFHVADEQDQTKLIKQALADLEIAPAQCAPRATLFRISNEKEALRTSEDVEKLLGPRLPPWERQFVRVFARYEELLREYRALDYSDLVAQTVRLLQNCPEVIEKLGLEWLLCDESQDLSPAQEITVDRLVSRTGNLTVVGDADQRVYSWRGANAGLILDFETRYPDGKIVPLGQNYRCSGAVVEAAAAVIKHNTQRIDHRLWTENAWGRSLKLLKCADADEEARRVSEELQFLRRQGIPYADMAILYRTNRQSLAFEEQLLYAGVPYRVFGTPFFARREIRDVLCWLRLIQETEDLGALEEVYGRPPRGCGKTSFEKVKAAARAQQVTMWSLICKPGALEGLGLPKAARAGLGTLSRLVLNAQRDLSAWTLPKLVDRILQESGLWSWYAEMETKEDRAEGRSRTENLTQLRTLLETQFPGLAAEELPRFLEHAALHAGEVQSGDSEEGVVLMTLHKSKGSEHRAVFLTGCEEEFLPHSMALREEDQAAAVEEERRLFYVGMTRVKERLILTLAARRLQPGGGYINTYPSRFLDEIPAGCFAASAARRSA